MGDFSLELSSAVNHISSSENKKVSNTAVLFSTKLKAASEQTGQVCSGGSTDSNNIVNDTVSCRLTSNNISNIREVTSDIDTKEELMFEKSKSPRNVEVESENSGISYKNFSGATAAFGTNNVSPISISSSTNNTTQAQLTRSQSQPQNLCSFSETGIEDPRRLDSRKSADGFVFPIMESNTSNKNMVSLSKEDCSVSNATDSLSVKNGESENLSLMCEISPICTVVSTSVGHERMITSQLEFAKPSVSFIMPTSTSSYWPFVGQNCEEYPSGMHTVNGNFSVQNSQLSTTPNINHINSVLNLSAGLGNQVQTVSSLSNNLFPQQYQYHRRAITGAHGFGRGGHDSQSLNEGYPEWNTPSQAWPLQQTRNSVYPWSATNLAGVQKQSVSNPASSLKKFPVSCGHLSNSPSKFRKNVTWPFSNYAEQQDLQANLRREDGKEETFRECQFTGNFNSSPLEQLYPLEQQILDIMKSARVDGYDPKGYFSQNVSKLQPKHYMQGKPAYFQEENHVLVDRQLEQLAQVGPTSIFHQKFDRIDESLGRYSRKVFVGGLPPDIDEEEITATFHRFGPLVVDWPHKAESKSYFPPKGYAFLLFQEEPSVQLLIDSCIQEDDRLYLCVSSPTIKDKLVQIRPWRISDADYVFDSSLPLDPRKTVFVGGVPRPLKAFELATIMDRLYGGVCYAGIDTDPELKYPKGAGRVAFSSQQSYIAAISARFVQLQHGDIEKRVEVKPYVLDDQMCDECQGVRCGGKFAPFFCANVTCLQYYCEQCWAAIHSRPGREFHKPLVKEGADRPRTVPFRWY
ncbi:cytoplasmic polyadenylation element-binding protein 3-like isoform X2 [Tachypleus tridentatus]|uniref:cytoplasmic polyadenylation element-binding protein 3-like isoform X2 n=1 Tax=Tachypleus tridentatus TaxID=6853 RepID=UPI003FD40329